MNGFIRVRARTAFLHAGGRTIVGRIAEVLHRAGVVPYVVCPADLMADAAAAVADVSTTVTVVGEHSEALRWRLVDAGNELVLLAEADAVYDERLLREAAGWKQPARLVESGSGMGLSVHLASERLSAGIDAPHEAGEPVDVSALPTYSLALRRRQPLFRVPVKGADDLGHARNVLARSASKGHQELLVYLLNRPAEVWLSRRIAESRITPNQLTALCNLLAFIATGLFATGQLWTGVVLALAVGIVDGLDGRQARIQVRTSKLGEIEHLLDKVYEISWTVALAWHFRATPWAFWLAGIWFVAYMLDGASYTVFKARWKYMLDEASPFDRAVRFVASCRNSNVAILLVGLIAGRPGVAGVVIVVWSVVIAAAHLLRALWWTRRHPPGSRPGDPYFA